MSYLVRVGSLTVVARSPYEANSLRERFENDGVPDVIVTDMDGHPVDIDSILTTSASLTSTNGPSVGGSPGPSWLCR